MKITPAFILAATLFIATSALAAHVHKEKEYQNKWCARVGGVTEYRLDDGTRVDCLTNTYAIEFDFAPKWAESIGQALYYSQMTGKQPGVVLIMENEGDGRYLERLNTVAAEHNIKVWTIR
jgi:hypothetical protein